jgi:hypothetical protein
MLSVVTLRGVTKTDASSRLRPNELQQRLKLFAIGFGALPLQHLYEQSHHPSE